MAKQQGAQTLKNGDQVILFEEHLQGYLYSEPTRSQHNCLWLERVTPPHTKKDPQLPDTNCAVFCVSFPEDKLDTFDNLKTHGKRPVFYGSHIRLQHIATGKFIAVNKNKVATNGELGDLMVDLVDSTDERATQGASTLFRILLQHGAETVGRQVNLGQPVILESVELPGQFLHCSTNSERRYEMNLSTESSALTFSPWCSVEKLLRPTAIRAGEFVQMSETQNSICLVAKGLNIEVDVYGQGKKYLGGWALDEDMRSWYPTSLWQLESVKKPLKGGVVKQKKYRIKHVISRKYLAVEKTGDSYKVHLTNCCDEKDSIFKLASFDQPHKKSPPVNREAWVAIKHHKTGMYLFIDHDMRIEKPQGLQFEQDLQLRRVTVSGSPRAAFNITSADERIDVTVCTVGAILPVLKDCVQTIEEKELSESTADVLNTELDSLSDLTKFPILRHFKILELLIKLLKLLDETQSMHKELARKVFAVFSKCAEGGESVCERNYFATAFRFLWEKAAKGVGADKLLLTLVKDNLPLIASLDEHDSVVAEAVEHLRLTKDPVWLEFLGFLCVCGEVPLQPQQDYILKFLTRPELAQNVLYRLVLKDGEVHVSTAPGNTASLTLLPSDSEEMRFLESQLKLFAKLCKGPNPQSIQALNGDSEGISLISFEELYAVANDIHFGSELRYICIGLLRVMYIQGSGKANKLYLSPCAWCFMETSDGLQSLQEHGSKEVLPSELIPRVKSWINEMVDSDSSNNEPKVMCAVYDLLTDLIMNGCYPDDSEFEPIYVNLICKQKFTLTPENKELICTAGNLTTAMFSHQTLCETKVLLQDFNTQRRGSELPPAACIPSCLKLQDTACNFLEKAEESKCSSIPMILESFAIQMALEELHHGVQLVTSTQSQQELQYIREKYPELVRCLGGGIVNSEQVESAAAILREMAARCYANGIPQRRNQDIYSQCVFEEVLKFVLCPTWLELINLRCKTTQSCTTLMEASLQFLATVACKNFEIQRRLFTHLDQLLQLENTVPEVAEVLAEIFAAGALDPSTAQDTMTKQLEEIHMRVQADQIETMFQLMQEHETGRSKLLYALQYIAKSEGLDMPVSRNEDLIMKQFAKSRGMFYERVLGNEKEKVDYRMKLLRKEIRSEHANGDLQLLLTLTGLLTACAEGKSLSIDAICQGVFSIKELLSILCDSGVCPAYKTPFIQLLVAVHLDCSDTQGNDITKDDGMWSYLKRVAELLESTPDVLADLSSTTVQELLLRPLRQFDVLCCTSLPKKDEGCFLYILKGVIPMVTFFFGRMLKSVSAGSEQAETCHRISKALCLTAEVLSKTGITKEYWKKVQGAVSRTLQTAGGLGTYDIPRCQFPSFDSHDSQMEALYNKDFKDYLDSKQCCAVDPTDPDFNRLLKQLHRHHVPYEVVLKLALYTWRESNVNENAERIICGFVNKSWWLAWAYFEQIKKKSGFGDLKVLGTQGPLDPISLILEVAATAKDDGLLTEALQLLASLLDSENNPIQSFLQLHTKRKRSKLHAALITLLQSLHRSFTDAAAVSKARVRDNREREQSSKSALRIPVFSSHETLGRRLFVLGKLCDGQNHILQDFLRNQRGRPDTVNIVCDVAGLLHHYRAICTEQKSRGQSILMSKEDTCIILKILQALIEFCGGNPLNQAAVASRQFSIDLSLILEAQVRTSDHLAVKAKAIELLEALVEEISDDSKAIRNQLQQGGLAKSLQQVLPDFHHSLETHKRFKVRRRVASATQAQSPEPGQSNIEMELQPVVHTGADVGPSNGASVAFSDKEASGAQHMSGDITDEQTQHERPKIDVDTARGALFHAYTCAEALRDRPWSKEDIRETKDKERRDALQYCEDQRRTIELFYSGDSPKESAGSGEKESAGSGEKIYTAVSFPYDPRDELREEVKEKVKWNVNRDTPEDRLRDYLDWMEAAKRDIKHQRKLRRFPLNLITVFSGLRSYTLLFLTFVLNLFILFIYAVPEDEIPPEHVEMIARENQTIAIKPDRPNWLADIIYVFGSFHLVLSLWMVIEYYALNWPHFSPNGWVVALIPTFLQSAVFEFWKKVKTSEKQTRIGTFLKPPDEKYLEVSVYGFRAVYKVVFLLCSILSLAFYGYFYCICTLYIIDKSDILVRVLRSVTKNGKSLLLVGVLGVLVLYIYAVVSFVFIHEAFYIDDSDVYCETLIQCFVTVLRYGLLDNLGLAVPLISGDFTEAAIRLLFDISFFIIVTTIGLNIIFGIIVDTFAELRDKKFKSEEDMKDRCFICGIASFKFDRDADNGFSDHIHSHHSMWNYIYYYVYLTDKNPHDHTAIEKQVYDQINSQRIDFFPLRTAKDLSEATKRELIQKMSVEVTRKIDDLQKALNQDKGGGDGGEEKEEAEGEEKEAEGKEKVVAVKEVEERKVAGEVCLKGEEMLVSRTEWVGSVQLLKRRMRA